MFFIDYPGHLIATIILAAFAVVMALAYRSKHLHGRKLWIPLLWLLQFAAAAVLLYLLWNPCRPQMSEQTVRNSVLVFFDTSESMSVVEEAGISRLDKAINIFKDKFVLPQSTGPEFKILGFDRRCYSANSSWNGYLAR